MEIILVCSIWMCLLVTSLARTREIGAVRALNISLLFSPVIGLIAVLLSKKISN